MIGKPENPSAFPQVDQDTDGEWRGPVHSHGGMTLRDYFAGQALASILSDAMRAASSQGAQPRPRVFGRETSQACYAIADSMLEARKVGA